MNQKPPQSRPDPAEHPEELLAAEVDGSATSDERRILEAHLAQCARCRSEVELSTKARAALAATRGVEAPGFTTLGLEDLRARAAAAGVDLAPAPGVEAQAPSPAVTDLAERRRRRGVGAPLWQRAAWGAGLAAAATLAAVFVFVGGGPSERETAARFAGDSAVTEAAPSPGEVIRAGGAYDRDSISLLADQLEGADMRTQAGGPPPAAPAASPPTEAGSEDAPYAMTLAGAEDVLSCLRRSGAVPQEADHVHLEEATFEGEPAYIGAFLSPSAESPETLVVVVVAPDDCASVLHTLTRSL